MDEEFMHKIDALREELGFPFKISSAYRCSKHPVEIRKKKPGAHNAGKAVDIVVNGQKAIQLLDAGIKAGMTGLGVSQKGNVASRFIHLDNLEASGSRPRPWIWSY